MFQELQSLYIVSVIEQMSFHPSSKNR